MAVITIVFSCMIGLLAAVFHIGIQGGTFSAGFVLYLAVSVGTFAAIGLASWMSARLADHTRSPAKTDAQAMEEWRDWQFQEDINDAVLRVEEAQSLSDDYIAPKRNSA